jgi:hypothetical protein
MDWRIEKYTPAMGGGLVIPWTPGHVACDAQITCDGAVVNDADTDFMQRNTLVISFLAQGQPHVAEVVYSKDLFKASGASVQGETTYGATLNASLLSLPWYLDVLGRGVATVHMEPADASQTRLVVEIDATGRGTKKAPKKKWKKPKIPKPPKPPRPPKKVRKSPGR